MKTRGSVFTTVETFIFVKLGRRRENVSLACFALLKLDVNYLSQKE
jgi:hypothetical protein